MRDVWAVNGIIVDAVDLEGAVERIDHAIVTRQRLSFVTPNLDWIVMAKTKPAARQRINEADLSLVDGMPVVKLAQLAGAPITERVAGSDLFDALRYRDKPSSQRIRVFFFGGREGAADKAKLQINGEQKGMICVGSLNPGFGSVEDMSTPNIIEQINAANPDFVVVSLGAMKGQTWIAHNLDKLNTPVIAHLGAVVDFVAGTIDRAPAWIAKSGLEWAYRIKAEPSLWKRYWKDATFLPRLGFEGLAARRNHKAVQSNGEGAYSTENSSTYLFHGQLSGELLQQFAAETTGEISLVEDPSRQVVLDFASVTHIDNQAIGQLLAFEAVMVSKGLKMMIANVPDDIRQNLQHNLLPLG